MSSAMRAEAVAFASQGLKPMARTAKPAMTPRDPGPRDPRAPHAGNKPVYFAAGGSSRAARPMFAAVYERERLAPGNIVVGPAIIWQLDTTTVIPPGWAATVDAWGNLVAEPEAGSP